jgi:hypothetical protein
MINWCVYYILYPKGGKSTEEGGGGLDKTELYVLETLNTIHKVLGLNI